jgi:flavin-dependent dehydrogenase
MANRLTLKDGSKIAIIGGGPAGSFFAHFIQKFGQEKGITFDVTIFDGKDFLQSGPKGCNLCAGVIAESLDHRLKEEGIFLPEKRIINWIEGYCLHLRHEKLPLSCKENGKSPIATVFRGNGPRYSTFPNTVSFDDFLMNWVQDHGAKVIPSPVWEIKFLPDKRSGVLNFGKKDSTREFEADLIVGSFGVNSRMIQTAMNLGFGYKPPLTLTAFQAELKLGHEKVHSTFGDMIHVFIPETKNIRFATVVPKGKYATITLIGEKNPGAEILVDFFRLKDISSMIPYEEPLCFCYPKIAISPARNPYTDRMVIIGDASYSRHYKNGIESAFHTARLAAETAVYHGVDASSFHNHYYKPAKKLIIHDNIYGRLLFGLNDLISSSALLSKSHISLAKKGKESNASKKIRSILWDMFTGNIPYKKIFFNMFDLKLQLFLFAHTIGYAVEKFKTLIENFDRKISDGQNTRSNKQ